MIELLLLEIHLMVGLVQLENHIIWASYIRSNTLSPCLRN